MKYAQTKQVSNTVDLVAGAGKRDQTNPKSAGRPKSVVVPEINAVRELIKQDRHPRRCRRVCAATKALEKNVLRGPGCSAKGIRRQYGKQIELMGHPRMVP
ncbi:hypothetical protein NPIL_177361 [Nephila pilipes]|uniref:Uncharacterized protein n=1 Tax=Nephila pilipes TaxID=299642 RepID=A0A8X6U280_NEPPI|nr:hypothetical protein NPIL_177361 [Nephila pilipes]